MYVFTVRLADADRAVYESLLLRVAQHPSETPEYLVARVLAFASSTRRESCFPRVFRIRKNPPSMYAT